MPNKRKADDMFNPAKRVKTSTELKPLEHQPVKILAPIPLRPIPLRPNLIPFLPQPQFIRSGR